MSRAEGRAALAAIFRRERIETADLDARVLVCAACGIDHAGLVRDPDVQLGRAAVLLSAWGVRRARREPVSRILGLREFWGLPIAITPSVLDPRSETEGLVGAVIDAIGDRRTGPLHILDLGTGSGAILCALLHELPGARGLAIDRSIEACRVARDNFAALGLSKRASVVCGSWADAISGSFDVLVSNPPYIPRAEIAGLDRDVRDHDPVLALDGGADGLDPYRAIAPRLPTLLRDDGVAGFECGWNQGQVVAEVLSTVLREVSRYRDLAGHDRVVVGQKETKGRMCEFVAVVARRPVERHEKPWPFARKPVVICAEDSLSPSDDAAVDVVINSFYRDEAVHEGQNAFSGKSPSSEDAGAGPDSPFVGVRTTRSKFSA